MRLPIWSVLFLFLLLTACDSDDDGTARCDFTMEFSGALEGNVSGTTAVLVGDQSASQRPGFDLWLTTRSEEDEVRHAFSEGTCVVAKYPPGSLFSSRLYVRFDHPLQTGRFRTDSDAGTEIVAYLGTSDCPVNIMPAGGGTLTLDRVTDTNIEGGFTAPLTVTSAGSDTLDATVALRFHALPLDSTRAECLAR